MSPLIILHLLLLLEHCEAQVSYLEGLGTMKAYLFSGVLANQPIFGLVV